MLTTNKVKTPRSFRIVGPQRQIDERETPHPKVERGEFGARLRDWRKNRVGSDPFRRLFGGGGEGDPNNTLNKIMRDAPEGKVNPNQIPVDDPAEMAEQIKGVAKYLGADVVGICHLDQLYVYSHRARGNAAMGEKPGDPVKHTSSLCHLPGFRERLLPLHEQQQQNLRHGVSVRQQPRHRADVHARPPTSARWAIPQLRTTMGGRRSTPYRLAINAGLGELGRHGMLIHEKYGSRLHLTVVTTDLPLAVDEPVDIGVEEFCKYCKKCARTCPSHSIPFGDKGVLNGVEKYLVNIETCYKYKLAGRGRVDQLRRLHFIVLLQQARYLVARRGHVVGKENSPVLRVLIVKPLLWMDDLIWGKRPWKRMKWLGYDNAPKTMTCNIPGCTAKHTNLQDKRLHTTNVSQGGTA